MIPALRVRLTAIYGGIFVVFVAVLLGASYWLMERHLGRKEADAHLLLGQPIDNLAKHLDAPMQDARWGGGKSKAQKRRRGLRRKPVAAGAYHHAALSGRARDGDGVEHQGDEQEQLEGDLVGACLSPLGDSICDA